jgi:hypothetical protein
MTITKSDFLLNFMMFCLGATIGRQIGDTYLMCHLAAKLADLMLVNLPHYIRLKRQNSCSTLIAVSMPSFGPVWSPVSVRLSKRFEVSTK